VGLIDLAALAVDRLAAGWRLPGAAAVLLLGLAIPTDLMARSQPLGPVQLETLHLRGIEAAAVDPLAAQLLALIVVVVLIDLVLQPLAMGQRLPAITGPAAGRRDLRHPDDNA